MNIIRYNNFGLALSNTLSQFVLRLISSLATLIATLAITYFLGVSEFGSFTKVIAFVSLSYLLIDFGINAVFLKDYKDKAESLFFNLFSLRVLMSILLFLMISITVLFLPYNAATGSGFSGLEKIGILLFSLTLFTQSFSLSANAILQKNFSYFYLVLPNIGYLFVFVIFLAIGIYYKSLILIFFSYIVAGALFANLVYRLLRRKFAIQLKLEDFYPFAKKLFWSSLPLGFILILNLIYFKVDTLILSFYKSSFDVGIYGFAYKIFEFTIAFPALFANSVYPALLEADKNKKTFYLHLRRFSYFLLSVSVAAFFILYAAAPAIKFFKKDLEYAILPLRILSFSLPFFFLTGLLQWVFVIKNKKNQLALIYLTSLFINVILNLMFIPRYGYIAAAYSTVFSEGLVLLWFLLLLQTNLKFSRIEK